MHARTCASLLVVDLRAQPADLAPRDVGPAYRLDEIVDRSGRDALDVGLTAYCNRDKFHALAVTWDEKRGRSLTISSSFGDRDGRLSIPLAEPIPLGEGPVELAARVDHAALQSAYAEGAGAWRDVGCSVRGRDAYF